MEQSDRYARDPADGDILRRLEQRLERASSAAERLIGEARAAASGAGKSAPPPSGWQSSGSSESSESERRDSDLDVIVSFLRSVRDLVPPELQRRLAEAVRELLLALRALIDWYLERSERARREVPEVRDIPIA